MKKNICDRYYVCGYLPKYGISPADVRCKKMSGHANDHETAKEGIEFDSQCEGALDELMQRH